MRLVMLHGFSQSPAAWEAVRRHLPAGVDGVPLDVVTPEVPHGPDFAATAHAVADESGVGLYCGYSMGGRLCLRAALDVPGMVRGLVLVSASPGIASPVARARRAAQDAQLAAEVRVVGLERFLERWLAQPLFSTLAAGPEEIRRRAEATSADRLEHQLRVLGQGAQQPMWHRLGQLRMPVAVVTGRADSTYEAIGDAIAAAVASSVRIRLEGGHALPLEQPAAMANVLVDMVRRLSAHNSPS